MQKQTYCTARHVEITFADADFSPKCTDYVEEALPPLDEATQDPTDYHQRPPGFPEPTERGRSIGTKANRNQDRAKAKARAKRRAAKKTRQRNRR